MFFKTDLIYSPLKKFLPSINLKRYSPLDANITLKTAEKICLNDS